MTLTRSRTKSGMRFESFQEIVASEEDGGESDNSSFTAHAKRASEDLGEIRSMKNGNAYTY